MENEKNIVINSSVDVIDIQVQSLDVEIETIDSGDSINMIDSTIACEENIKVEDRGSTLFIKEGHRNFKSVLKNVKTVVNNNMIINGKVVVNGITLFSSANDILSNNRRIKVVLNDNDKFKFIVETLNGNIIVKNLKTDVLSIKTTNGDIEINDSNIDTFGIQTVNGDVNLNSVSLNNSVIYTESGDVGLKNFVSNNCHLSLKSSDISLNDGNINNCQLLSNEGDVDFKNFDAVRLCMSTNNGDITLSDINVASAKLNSLCGDVRVEILESLLNYKTVLSSICGNTVQNSIETEHPVILEEKNKLEVKTTNGDIKVLFKGKKN